jgi:hypothetical protein
LVQPYPPPSGGPPHAHTSLSSACYVVMENVSPFTVRLTICKLAKQGPPPLCIAARSNLTPASLTTAWVWCVVFVLPGPYVSGHFDALVRVRIFGALFASLHIHFLLSLMLCLQVSPVSCVLLWMCLCSNETCSVYGKKNI